MLRGLFDGVARWLSSSSDETPGLTESVIRSWHQRGEITSIKQTKPGVFHIEGNNLSFVIAVGWELAGKDQLWMVVFDGQTDNGPVKGTVRYLEVNSSASHVSSIVFSLQIQE